MSDEPRPPAPAPANRVWHTASCPAGWAPSYNYSTKRWDHGKCSDSCGYDERYRRDHAPNN